MPKSASLRMFHILVISANRWFEPLGCYRDDIDNRALPIKVANFRGNINWKNMTETIVKCSTATAEKYPSLQVFAVQYFGECYSGYDGLQRYYMYGALPYSDKITKNCWAGVGAAGINFVYKFAV